MTFFWIFQGKVDKYVRYSCHTFLGFNLPKITKIGQFLTDLFLKIKRWTFFGTQGSYTCRLTKIGRTIG